MAFKMIEGGICAPLGFTASGIHCGIRKNKEKKDLALVMCEKECDTAAVYTKNLVYGAPIKVTRANIADGKARGVICNSGIANTCSPDGVEKAQAMCELAAAATGTKSTDFIVASTGVIGPSINIEPIKNGMAELVNELSRDGSDSAANAIMTTDTVKKEFAVEFILGGKTCRIGAIAKGSGMIHPNMATMLCFITTDADISSKCLKSALLSVIDDSFNMLSIDGDTSTNDTVAVLASGLCGNERIDSENSDYTVFTEALSILCKKTVRLMAKDGEGATKLIECFVSGAENRQIAKTCAKSVISSALVKSAMFGADANCGRILCAIGYSGVQIDVDKIGIEYISDRGTVTVCQNGTVIDFSEEKAKDILSADEIQIAISLNDGEETATAWGCDLTYDYVKINGDYRT